MPLEQLPRLGLGLSSNLNASDEPHPYRLLEAQPGLFDFVEYSAPLSLEQASQHASLFPELWERRATTPVLFHPVHLNLYGPELEPPDRLRELEQHAREVGSPWVGNDVGWWHTRGEAFPGYLYISPPLNEAGLQNAIAHAQHVQAQLSVPLVLENPAVIAVRGSWHVLDFMAKLHAATQAPLLLDLGHLWSHQLARGLELTSGFDGFPFEQVAEIHLAGGVVSRVGERRFYVDDHTQMVREELFELLAHVLPRCGNLKALTFEGDGHPAAIAAITLRRLRSLIAPGRSAASGSLSEGVYPHPWTGELPVQGEGNGVRLFEESYGLCASSEDPVGVAAELDFRLAVLAEHLDRAYPITRLLLAPTREGLLSFTRAPTFRACFVDAERSVDKAFEAFAIAALRREPDRALEAVIAIESLKARGGGAAARRALPFDLSEAEFAARSLRRHLCGRAWVSGALEHSALEALWQAVRRAGSEIQR